MLTKHESTRIPFSELAGNRQNRPRLILEIDGGERISITVSTWAIAGPNDHALITACLKLGGCASLNAQNTD
jgi:hypothetical protein